MQGDRTAPVRPKFSIVIPAFNAAEFIGETLLSIRKQQFPSLEVLVMDGGSTDDTALIARDFEGLAVSVFSEPDGGQLDAVQKGLKRSTGEIFYWLNADDVLLPGSLRLVASVFDRLPEVDLVYSDDFAFHAPTRTLVNGGLIKGLSLRDHVLFYRQMYSECIFWRRGSTRFLSDDWFDLRVATDYAFFLNLRRGLREQWVRKRLGAFRVADGQVSERAAQLIPQERSRIRAAMYEQLGWGAGSIRRRQILHAPSFWLRQVVRPAAHAAMRALRRKLDGGTRRREMAAAFFGKWLNPEVPPSDDVERLLFR
jgi:glycosyltransferase involved in cell wall biosynthesis